MMIEGQGFIEELKSQGIKLPDDIISMNIDIPANGTIKINYLCHLNESILNLMIKALNNHE